MVRVPAALPSFPRNSRINIQANQLSEEEMQLRSHFTVILLVKSLLKCSECGEEQRISDGSVSVSSLANAPPPPPGEGGGARLRASSPKRLCLCLTPAGQHARARDSSAIPTLPAAPAATSS